MRNSKRIPIVLQIMKDWRVLSKFIGSKSQSLKINVYTNWDEIEKVWKESPDLRFGQLLCNMRFIDSIDIENKIWNIEEDQWLIDNKYVALEDIKFWGINYDINNERLSKTRFKLLRDLSLDHIKNIIIFFEKANALERLNKSYLEYFNKRIKDNV